MNDLYAKILAENILDSMYDLAYRVIKEVGLWDEFIEFSSKYPLCTLDVFKEFASMHPDKLHYSDLIESYGHFCINKFGRDSNE